MAVWWVWIYTAWITNWIDPDKPAVRLMLFALILAGWCYRLRFPAHHGLALAGGTFLDCRYLCRRLVPSRHLRVGSRIHFSGTGYVDARAGSHHYLGHRGWAHGRALRLVHHHALGESILITGATFTGLVWTAATIAAFIVAFVSSVAMWVIYFKSGAERGRRHIASSDNPGRIARNGYTYIHLVNYRRRHRVCRGG
jgi:hypothetical protein